MGRPFTATTGGEAGVGWWPRADEVVSCQPGMYRTRETFAAGGWAELRGACPTRGLRGPTLNQPELSQDPEQQPGSATGPQLIRAMAPSTNVTVGLSLVERVQPRVGIVAPADCTDQPVALFVFKVVDAACEVVGVSGAGLGGLVQQLDVKGDVGDAVIGVVADLVDGEMDRGVTPIPPTTVVVFLQQDLQAPWAVRLLASP